MADKDSIVTKNYGDPGGEAEHIGGALNIEDGGVLNVNSGGVIEIESGGKETVKGGGVLEVAATANVNVKANATVTLEASGGLVAAASSAVTLDPQARVTGAIRLAKAVFDPSTTAGMRTVAAHGLGVSLPSGAIILRAFYKVHTTFTSAGDAATIALSIEGANDTVSAIAISNGGNPWDAGLHATIEDNTLTNAVTTTGVKEITATVAVEPLTAGKLTLFVEYYVP